MYAYLEMTSPYPAGWNATTLPVLSLSRQLPLNEYYRVGTWRYTEVGQDSEVVRQPLPVPMGWSATRPIAIAETGTTLFETFETDGTDPVPQDTSGCSYVNEIAHDVWFRFVATASASRTLTTCDPNSFDTDVVVYEDGEQVACNGDGPEDNSCQQYYSRVAFSVVAGREYLVRVGGYTENDFGQGRLTIG